MSLRRVAPLALVALLAGCGSSAAASKPTATAIQLPDGSTATTQQAAYLDAVKPAMTPVHAADVMDTLRLGADVCRLGLTDQWYVDTIQSQEGYNLTEATAIVHQARAHLCG